MTRVLGSADVGRIIAARGVDKTFDELIERLHDALVAFDAVATLSPVRDGFTYAVPHDGLLEWMPTMEVGRVVAIKTVGYHPANPSLHDVPSVMATTSVYDTATGRLRALVDATLLTALRTGAASAVATDVLAKPGPVVLGVVGCGTQAVTQVHGVSRVRPIERILAVDSDPRVAASFARRIGFIDRPCEVVPVADRDRLLAEADVLCTCTSVRSGAGPVLGEVEPQPWLHINAVGSDFPGKQEIPLAILRRALLCPDFAEQCRVEGECQWIDGEHVGPDLATLVKERERYEAYRSALTVFDSTGWALEDLVAAELFLDLATLLDVGGTVQVHPPAGNPYDPYVGLAL